MAKKKATAKKVTAKKATAKKAASKKATAKKKASASNAQHLSASEADRPSHSVLKNDFIVPSGTMFASIGHTRESFNNIRGQSGIEIIGKIGNTQYFWLYESVATVCDYYRRTIKALQNKIKSLDKQILELQNKELKAGGKKTGLDKIAYEIEMERLKQMRLKSQRAGEDGMPLSVFDSVLESHATNIRSILSSKQAKMSGSDMPQEAKNLFNDFMDEVFDELSRLDIGNTPDVFETTIEEEISGDGDDDSDPIDEFDDDYNSDEYDEA